MPAVALRTSKQTSLQHKQIACTGTRFKPRARCLAKKKWASAHLLVLNKIQRPHYSNIHQIGIKATIHADNVMNRTFTKL
jgi:hypothetical protein